MSGKNAGWIDDSQLQFEDVSYERRLVIFFDTLGWRNHIDEAGKDPQLIARLASVPRVFTTMFGAIAFRDGFQASSFSDNVVMSVPWDSSRLGSIVRVMGIIQLFLACRGFFIRGGMTLGDIYHDDEIVFGPALNRVYKLESEMAIAPRILIDADVPELRVASPPVVLENGEWFLDPFFSDFAEDIQRQQGATTEQLDAVFERMRIKRLSEPTESKAGSDVVRQVLRNLNATIDRLSVPRPIAQLGWLRDRLALRL